MENRKFTQEEIVSLCEELALLMHAGVSTGDGFSWLAEQAKEEDRKTVLKKIADDIDMGATLPQAVRDAGCFPLYVTGLLEVGEMSGRTEEALKALSVYYENRIRMDRRIRSALLYPAILLVLMLVVIVVLLSKVLPMFNEVYASLGSSLTGVAGGLLVLGRGLDAAMPVLLVVLAAAVIGMAAFFLSDSFREKITAWWTRTSGDTGISRKLADARFANALKMGMQSGLPMEEALDLSAKLLSEIPAAVKRCEVCREKLMAGEEMSEALNSSGVLPAASCRLLALGQRSGTADAAMEEIARRLQEEADDAMEDMASRVEPALVLITSLLVGAILLSVMLPLMNIMTTIG